jgi:hypothetical protein
MNSAVRRLTLLLSLSTAAAVQVDAQSVLASVTQVLDELFLPFETTASTLKAYVEAGPAPFVAPTPAEAGLVPGTPKGDLATAIFVSYEDTGTNGLWVTFNSSGFLGYWNINGIDSRITHMMYRPPGQGNSTGCPEITTSPACTTVTVGTMRPASCDAIPSSCQTYHTVKCACATSNPHRAQARYRSVNDFITCRL